jgi:hypothetical protein
LSKSSNWGNIPLSNRTLALKVIFYSLFACTPYLTVY